MSNENLSPIPPAAPGSAPPPLAPTPGKPARSTLGLVALILAVVGFVLVLIPLIGVVGFILLVAAFVLSIVALAQKGRQSSRSYCPSSAPIVGGIVLGVTAVNVVGDALEDAGVSIRPTGDGSPTESSAPAPDTAAVPLGSAATTGNLALTVTGVEPGVAQLGTTIGDTFLGEKAQGQFVLVHVSVANTGNESELFSDAQAKVLDAQGREFSANSAAGVYIDGNSAFGGEINPGNSLAHVLVFDIPLDAVATTLHLPGAVRLRRRPGAARAAVAADRQARLETGSRNGLVSRRSRPRESTGLPSSSTSSRG